MKNATKLFVRKLLFSTILAGNIGIGFETIAFTIDRDRTSLGRPWGYSQKGNEILAGSYSMRDTTGNLTITNQFDKARFAKGFGYNFTSQSKLTEQGNGSTAPGGFKLIGNQFTVVTQGTFNTVLINNIQENHADFELNGTLNEFE